MFGSVGPMEMVLLMALGVLLFGKRLPEVGRSLGKGIVEFKKGLNGIGDDLESSTSSSSSSSYRSSSDYGPPRYGEGHASGDSAYADTAAPKFELPGTASAAPAAAEPAITTAVAEVPSVPHMDEPAVPAGD